MGNSLSHFLSFGQHRSSGRPCRCRDTLWNPVNKALPSPDLGMLRTGRYSLILQYYINTAHMPTRLLQNILHPIFKVSSYRSPYR